MILSENIGWALQHYPKLNATRKPKAENELQLACSMQKDSKLLFNEEETFHPPH